ncbi:Uncharacterized protein SCF082_LOCUS33950 [Durusdinium trenchii]|uniref:Apple domain-containing protein n=1 Tax=Durusdinium trenchii TaxID=1381693 RepID=A0ABP0NTP8_9DINO
MKPFTVQRKLVHSARRLAEFPVMSFHCLRHLFQVLLITAVASGHDSQKSCARNKGNFMLQMRTAAARSRVDPTSSTVLPARTYCYGTKYSDECYYLCPLGFELMTRAQPDASGECGNTLGSSWARKKHYYMNPADNECATCDRTSEVLPTTAMPFADPACTGASGSECTLSCPTDYMLSKEKEVCAAAPGKEFAIGGGSFLPSDGVPQATCSSLGVNYVASITFEDGCGLRTYGGTVVETGTRYVCHTCLASTTSSTTSSSMGLTVGREWEEFAGPQNRACRGFGPTDNNPAYFDVHLNVASLESCQDLCLQELGEEGCKGVEFNSRSKRCELWKRKEGIWAFAYPEWEGFTCWRYGWPGKYLIPVNGGLNQACRGPNGRNSNAYYVVEPVKHMEDCRARCVAAKVCKGVEFSKGRCEIWHTDIVTTAPRSDFECLRYQPPV